LTFKERVKEQRRDHSHRQVSLETVTSHKDNRFSEAFNMDIRKNTEEQDQNLDEESNKNEEPRDKEEKGNSELSGSGEVAFRSSEPPSSPGAGRGTSDEASQGENPSLEPSLRVDSSSLSSSRKTRTISKSRYARPATAPGAVAASSSGSEVMVGAIASKSDFLDARIAAKIQASSGTNSSSLESDAMEKTRASVGRRVGVGAFASTTGKPLKGDSINKSTTPSLGSRTVVGAVASKSRAPSKFDSVTDPTTTASVSSEPRVVLGAVASRFRAPSKFDSVTDPTTTASVSSEPRVVLGAVASRFRAPSKFDSVTNPTTTATATSSSESEVMVGAIASKSDFLDARIAAKVQASSGGAGRTVLGAVASLGPLPSKMDCAIVNPTAIASTIGTTMVSSASEFGMSADFSNTSDLTSLATDVAAKIQASNGRRSGVGAITSTGPEFSKEGKDGTLQDKTLHERTVYENDNLLRTLEVDMAAKSQIGGNVRIINPPDTKKGEGGNPPMEQPTTKPYRSDKDMSVPEKWYDEDANGGTGGNDIHSPHDDSAYNEYGTTGPATGMMADADPATTPLINYGDAVDLGDHGIEAYMAEEKKVFDAVGVLTLKSKEEEELEEKHKFRKYLLLGVIALILVAVAIVTPVAVIFGKVEPSLAPSVAPSVTLSLAPSTTRLAETVDYLSENLNLLPDDFRLDNEASPQYLAADWIANEDESSPEVGTNQFLQRYILAVFYFSTGGDETWEDCHRNDPRCTVGFSWLRGSQPECKWYGVRCDEPGKVTRILIGQATPLGNGLVGTIPSELGQLSLLTALTLVGGIFKGGKLRGTIPSELGLLSQMNSIYIQAHKLTGTIPKELTKNKPNLEMLAITNNRLNGTLPTNLVGSTILRDLQFHGNKLTGTIPELYGTFTSLDNLELSHNRLNGTIPENLYNLSLLAQLSLDNNKFSGRISTRIAQLVNLKIIEARDNLLTGSIPTTLFTMPNLAAVRIDNNALNGSLSEDIALLNETLKIFEANNNNFSGQFPLAAFESMGYLRELKLHSTNLIGNASQILCNKPTLKNLTVPLTVDCEKSCCDLQI